VSEVTGQALAELLDRSAERDASLRARLAAWREGCARGAGQRFEEGYVTAIADVKRAQHELVDRVRLEVRRLAPGGAAWLASVERHGGTEFGGIGHPRVPVGPADIERARRMLKGGEW
jgi:hypothetical protein